MPVDYIDPSDAKLMAQARAAAPKTAAVSAPVVTPAPFLSNTFIGPIPVGSTRTTSGYVTSAGTVVNPQAPYKYDPVSGDFVPTTPTSTSTKVTTPTSTGLTQSDIDKAVNAAIAAANAGWQSKYDALASSQKLANQANVTTALEDFKANLKLAGLDSLADVIDGYIKQDMTAAQIKINLVGSQAYKDRFPAMATLAAAGRAVNEATYISMERGYEQVLRAYGIDTATFGTRAQLGKYIGAEVSPVEFEQRVQIAKDRVDKNADVTSALQDYYGVSKGGAIAFLLDPALGMDIVKKEARAAEIGAAAVAAGFGEFKGKENVGVAESFVNASGTQDLVSLKAEFGKARNLANTQGRLAAMEGSIDYKDLDAVTAILGQDTQELLKSQRRAARETARFSGTTGVGAQSLRNNQVGI
jgi:hypothetical protein